MEQEILNVSKEMQLSIREVQTNIKEIKQDVSELKERVTTLENRTERLESKVNSISKQTADLVEFKAETNRKLDMILNGKFVLERII